MMFYIIIAIVLLLTIYILVTYNSLIKLNNIVKEAFSTMDIYLKKRWDLIPNLVEVVKEYAKYEKDVFNQITTRVLNTFEYFKILQALIMLYFFVKFFPKLLRKFAVSVIMCPEVYE